MNEREAYRRLQEIFLHASALATDELATYLESACADNPDMRAEVEAMLAAESQVGTFLESPAISPPSAKRQTTDKHDPKIIGPYRLQKRLGAGGMGVVYLAEQMEPVRRQVALKLIKIGMDTEQIVARFELERQALAMMEHPGIARVLDAGATDDGRPYFVMEVVRGTPITDFCDKKGLSLDQRLALFARVCDALNHAHQKGIIHRDIKPSNVLVESRGGEVTPKIIDFGIAKATNQRLIEGGLHTGIGQIIGTPEYMSPEQADASGLDIDTRSDIYSMGVMLYELLAGILPFDLSADRSAGLGRIQRILSEEVPPTPSTRVSSVDGPKIACGLSPRELGRKLKGDLDWIVMKAIDKDLDRRYQAVSEFASDIRRYLANEPVLASPPGSMYRLRKFVRRHRTAVAGCVAGILLLLGGVVATTSQAIRATRAEREALHQAALAADVNDFLISMLSEANPANRPAGTDFTVVDALETAAHIVDAGDRSPRLEAEVRRVVGITFYSLGRYDEAELQTRSALETLQSLDEVPDIEVARLKVQLGAILVDSGESDEAIRNLEEARTIFTRAGDDYIVDWAAATNELADVATTRGDHKAAEELNNAALAAARSGGGDTAATVEASVLIDLGSLDLELMNVESAEARIREGLSLQRAVLGENHPSIAGTQLSLAKVLSEKGEFDTADQLFQASLETTRKVFGESHIRVAVVLHNYGFHLMNRNPQQAEIYLREAVRLLEGRGNAVAVARALDVLAAAQLDSGDYDQAEKSFLRALDLRRDSLPDEHLDIAQSLNNLGSLHMRSGRYDQAVPLLADALERYSRLYGEKHPMVVVVTYNLGSAQSDAGTLAEARGNLEAAFSLAAEIFPAGHLNTAVMQAKYGECLSRLHRFTDAEALLLPARAQIEVQLGSEHWRTRQASEMIAEHVARKENSK